MKKTLLLLTLPFLIFLGQANAQSLDFSRVLLVSTLEDTVPPGKVWKVNSLLTSWTYQDANNTTCTQLYYGENRAVYLNGNKRLIQADAIATGSGGPYFSGGALPLWLPAGTRIRTSCPASELSIIEFTVTP
ncbi:MAG: hypothetical protein H6581_14990 [Bacteroidia bacterium]|nr:hypothetical protein [Bacteroidia bacterium]